jgi:hypothetical protein
MLNHYMFEPLGKPVSLHQQTDQDKIKGNLAHGFFHSKVFALQQIQAVHHRKDQTHGYR